MPDVPLTRDQVDELRSQIRRGFLTPGQAAALYGIDRRAAEVIASQGTMVPGPRPEAPGRPALRSPAPGRPDRRPPRHRPA